MSILDHFARVSRSRPCPVCERPDWCLLHRDDPADPALVVCARIESQTQWGSAGWLHRLRDDRQWPGRRRRDLATREFDSPTSRDLTEDAATFRRLGSLDRIDELGRLLGVSSCSLDRMQVGWAGDAWTFPMRDACGVVRGIRLRQRDGSKRSVRGGRDGLFLPDAINTGGRLLIAEGPSDTAALLDLGFDAIGRPSCRGGRRHLAAYVARHEPSEIVIVADGDEMGRSGALDLAGRLRVHCRRVRVVSPPAGHSDARAWVGAGATRSEIEQVIDAALLEPLLVSTVAGGER